MICECELCAPKPKEPHCGSIFCESATPPLPAKVEARIKEMTQNCFLGAKDQEWFSANLRSIAHLARKAR